jgi:hypothetical protein
MKGRERAQRRARARISWFAHDGWGPVIKAFGPLPPEGQQRLGIRLFGARYLNTGAAALADKDQRNIRKVARYARKHLASVDDKRVQSIVAALNRLDMPAFKPKEAHTLLLEGLFDAYVMTRSEYPSSGPSAGFDEALRTFLDAVFELIGLGSMYSVGCLINEDEARGAWNRWLRTHRRSFLSLK